MWGMRVVALNGLILALLLHTNDAVNLQATRPLVRRGSSAEEKEASLAQIDDDDDDDGGHASNKDKKPSAAGSKTSEEEVNSMMETMDVNQDSALSWKEVIAYFNRDGSSDIVTQAELDAGGFGPMTTPEKNELKEMFDMSDTDHDGKISKEELAKFLSAEESHSEAKYASGSDESEDDNEDESEDLPSDAVSLMEENEAAKSMTKEEHDEEVLASFSDADTNKDGVLSMAEVIDQLEREEAEDAQADGRKYDAKALVNAEARKEAMEKFKAADTDGNNLLTKAEFSAVMQVYDEKEEEQLQNAKQLLEALKKKKEALANEPEGDKSEEELAVLSGAREDQAGSEES